MPTKPEDEQVRPQRIERPVRISVSMSLHERDTLRWMAQRFGWSDSKTVRQAIQQMRSQIVNP